MTGVPGGRPQTWIDGCVAAQRALEHTLAGLRDEEARQMSGLPGWSVGHVLTHVARVERVMAELPDAAWDASSRTSRGVLETSRDAVLARWREVVVHHGDLGLAPVAFPPELLAVWLPRELPRLAERTDPARLLGWIVGRTDPPELDPW